MGGHSFAIAGSFRNVDRSDKNSAVSHRFQRPIKKKKPKQQKKKNKTKENRCAAPFVNDPRITHRARC